MEFGQAFLARWWRRRRSAATTDSSTQTTELHAVARLPEARAMLREELDELLRVLAEEGEYTSHTALLKAASLECLLGEFDSALVHLTRASNVTRLTKLTSNTMLGRDDGVNHTNHLVDAWIVKLERIITIQELQLVALRSARLKPKTLPVARLSLGELSKAQFMERFAHARLPVIITSPAAYHVVDPTGAVNAGAAWTMERLRSLLGNKRVEPKRVVVDSMRWARLVECAPIAMQQYLDEVVAGTTDAYVHDYSLPLHCPEVMDQLSIPKYFSGDLLQSTTTDSLYREGWPSLFVGPQGSRSPLHIDAFQSNFWMAMFQGKKKWTFYHAEHAHMLYPEYSVCDASLEHMFAVDRGVINGSEYLLKSSGGVSDASGTVRYTGDPLGDSVDHDQFPLFHQAPKFECVLEEGELLYVPFGSPHHVLNLTHTVAVSGNYVDASNLSAVVGELAVMRLTNPLAGQLHSQLQRLLVTPPVSTSSDNVSAIPAVDVEECPAVPWREFKQGRGSATLSLPLPTGSSTSTLTESASIGAITGDAPCETPLFYTVFSPQAAQHKLSTVSTPVIDDTNKIHRELF